jgi:hypothetical protein
MGVFEGDVGRRVGEFERDVLSKVRLLGFLFDFFGFSWGRVVLMRGAG